MALRSPRARQNGAGSTSCCKGRIMQYKLCKGMQSYAELCKVMQTMQNQKFDQSFHRHGSLKLPSRRHSKPWPRTRRGARSAGHCRSVHHAELQVPCHATPLRAFAADSAAQPSVVIERRSEQEGLGLGDSQMTLFPESRVLEFVGWDDSVPVLLKPCCAVPEGTTLFILLIMEAQFINRLCLDWGVMYTTAAQLSSSLNNLPVISTSASTFPTSTTSCCGGCTLFT
jgi:hypothetical protein